MKGMKIIPAVDILDGQAVRLLQGDYNKVTVYDKDPIAAAQRLQDAGVSRIHLVDLDAARGQGKSNRKLISKLCSHLSCTIETGGGIRKKEDVEELLDAGVDYLIIGTALAKDPSAVSHWIQDAPGHFIAGIDARDGYMKISGWEGDSSLSDTQAALLAKDLGFSEILYTNISKDGTLAGPDLENSFRIAQESGLPVIISGGVGSGEHVEAAFAHEGAGKAFSGVIIGKAWYEGHIDLKALCKTYRQGEH